MHTVRPCRDSDFFFLVIIIDFCGCCAGHVYPKKHEISMMRDVCVGSEGSKKREKE